MKLVLHAARVTRDLGSFGVNVVFPIFGIARPWNYFAGAFWLFWLSAIAYRIVTS